jgi:SAM-dependent methyltransferase
MGLEALGGGGVEVLEQEGVGAWHGADYGETGRRSPAGPAIASDPHGAAAPVRQGRPSLDGRRSASYPIHARADARAQEPVSHRPALARLRKTLARHAREGWTRAVFAKPGQDDAPQVLEGPGPGAPDEASTQALLQAAEVAAAEGRVKQTLVLDEQRRVRVDARHGRGTVVTLDEARARKVMGGKDRALRPDASAPLLRIIGIMNADGTISADSAKKYKQVNHFVELCRPVWERLMAQRPASAAAPLRVLDLGCGNGYLGFVLAEALRLVEIPTRLHGVDRRADVIEQCRARAQVLGYEGLSFQEASIDEVDLAATPLAAAGLEGAPDLVVALHACDTATDDALALAVRAGASSILAAPCCQHELAEQLQHADGAEQAAPVPALLRHSILRKDYAAGLTDALRVELLEACGYHVDAIEFVGSQHTPKNLLLRAHRRHPGTPVEPGRWRLQRVRERCEKLGVRPRLLEVLSEAAAATPAPEPALPA